MCLIAQEEELKNYTKKELEDFVHKIKLDSLKVLSLKNPPIGEINTGVRMKESEKSLDHFPTLGELKVVSENEYLTTGITSNDLSLSKKNSTNEDYISSLTKPSLVLRIGSRLKVIEDEGSPFVSSH